MKVFLIKASNASYEEDISMVIVAETKERALEIAKNSQPYDWKQPDKYDFYWDFKEHQYPLIVTEIDLKKEQVIEVSNRGS